MTVTIIHLLISPDLILLWKMLNMFPILVLSIFKLLIAMGISIPKGLYLKVLLTISGIELIIAINRMTNMRIMINALFKEWPSLMDFFIVKMFHFVFPLVPSTATLIAPSS